MRLATIAGRVPAAAPTCRRGARSPIAAPWRSTPAERPRRRPPWSADGAFRRAASGSARWPWHECCDRWSRRSAWAGAIACRANACSARRRRAGPATTSASRLRAGTHAGHRRRIGLGQEHAGAAGDGARAHRARASCASRAVTCTRCEPAALRAARRDFQMVFQDPLRFARPAPAVGAHRRRAAGRLLHGVGRAEQRERAAKCSTRWACAPRDLDKVPARILGRPAPAHRDRARADHAAEADRRRRAGERARRVGAGPGAQPDAGPAAAFWA